jgi:hypothetical protein
MTTILASQSISLIQPTLGGTVYYSVDGGSSTAINAWPVTLTNTNPGLLQY